MTVAPGTRLGPYEITARLGEGGMGEVFRATDTKLRREVAVKVLPEAFTEDRERLARFEREAQLLAQLQHPNIASIYGMEESGATRALVMELVEGPTLAERLAPGGLSLSESLSIARQIAEALEAAHEKGIVHRDLKPQNIKASDEGKVKVLDFGLAKAMEPVSSSSGGPVSASPTLMNSPTLTAAGTQLGVILGTAAYMAPEQARGAAVDKRADIWAFGVVLWEMLTGARLFAAETVTDTLAGVLKTEIDLAQLPPDTPPAIRRLLRRCLQRQPKNRLHDVADARIVIDEVLSGAHEPTPEPAAAAAARRWLGWTAAFLCGALVAWGLARVRAPEASEVPSAPLPRAEFRQLTSLGGAEWAPALAPDGESFAYVKEIGGQKDVFLQRVGGSNAVNLTEACSEDDDEPAFSPDGRRIAYRSECGGGGIFVMGATGESARKVTEEGFNPSWSPDGLELAIADEKLQTPFGRGTKSRLWAVRVETGERRLLAAPDAVQPSWSPDGRRVAFWGLTGDTSVRNLYTVAADGSQSSADAAVPVLAEPPLDWSPVWTADSRALIFASTRGGTMNLWRVGVDPSGRATGEPQPLTAPSSWVGYLSISATGKRLAFVDRNIRSAIRTAPFDPVRGEIAGPAAALPIGTMEIGESVELAPDGSVLFDSAGLPQHLFLADAAGGLRQLTEGPHRDRQGSFSPDGRWVYFQSDRWLGDLGRIRRDGSGLAEVLPERRLSLWYPLVSPDGRWLVASSNLGAFRVPLDGESVAGPEQLLPAPPDGLSFWAYSVAADGGRVAGTLVSAANVSTGAAVLDLERGEFRRISDERTRQVRFLPDGRRLLLSSSDGVDLVGLGGGARRRIYEAPEGAEIQWIGLSPDGRRLAWHESSDESDLWLVDFEDGP